jgi:excisionase family DNA binding protein
MENQLEKIENELRIIKELLIGLEKKTEKDERPLTIQEAAEFLDLSVSTIYSKSSRGEIPFIKSKKRVYFSRTELLEYIKSGHKK